MQFYGNQDLNRNTLTNYIVHNGLLADRPTVASIGQLYVATDVEFAYIYTSTGWKNLTTGEIAPPVKGLIFMWSGNTANIPSGYALCDGTAYPGITNLDLRDKFIKCTLANTNPGSSGGTAAHNHSVGSHTHTITTGLSTSVYSPAPDRLSGGVDSASSSGHGHSVSAENPVTYVTIDNTSSTTVLPEYYELAFIIKLS